MLTVFNIVWSHYRYVTSRIDAKPLSFRIIVAETKTSFIFFPLLNREEAKVV